jgi:hypothetical protein
MKMKGRGWGRENLCRLSPWAVSEGVRMNRRVSYFREI